MATKVLDNYRQWAVLSHDIVDAGGSAYSGVTQLITGLSNLQKVAWAVSRIEYWIPAALYKTMAVLDEFIGVFLTASGLATQVVALTNASIYDIHLETLTLAAAAGTTLHTLHTSPVVHDFGLEPMLVLPQNLYLGAFRYDTATAATQRVSARIFYKEVELGPENWYDLLQLRLPLGAS